MNARRVLLLKQTIDIANLSGAYAIVLFFGENRQKIKKGITKKVGGLFKSCPLTIVGDQRASDLASVIALTILLFDFFRHFFSCVLKGLLLLTAWKPRVVVGPLVAGIYRWRTTIIFKFVDFSAHGPFI